MSIVTIHTLFSCKQSFS